MVKVTPVDYYFKFDKDFYKSIWEEIKTTTIRDESKPVEIDDYVFCYFKDIEKVCLVRILNHYARKVKDITYKEADKEGYKHPDLLKHELVHIYPNLKDDDYVYIYKFKLITNESWLCSNFLESLQG